MGFADWTFSSITGTQSCGLDGTTKYAGNSSARMSFASFVSTTLARLTHDTFLEQTAQLVGWVRHNAGNYGSVADCRVRLSTYGAIGTAAYAGLDTWEKFRFTFWYDIASNTRWGRLEKFISSAWVQHGGDINCGTGSPSAGEISLEARCVNYRGGEKAWFDELEVSA